MYARERTVLCIESRLFVEAEIGIKSEVDTSAFWSIVRLCDQQRTHVRQMEPCIVELDQGA